MIPSVVAAGVSRFFSDGARIRDAWLPFYNMLDEMLAFAVAADGAFADGEGVGDLPLNRSSARASSGNC